MKNHLLKRKLLLSAVSAVTILAATCAVEASGIMPAAAYSSTFSGVCLPAGGDKIQIGYEYKTEASQVAFVEFLGYGDPLSSQSGEKVYFRLRDKNLNFMTTSAVSFTHTNRKEMFYKDTYKSQTYIKAYLYGQTRSTSVYAQYVNGSWSSTTD